MSKSKTLWKRAVPRRDAYNWRESESEAVLPLHFKWSLQLWRNGRPPKGKSPQQTSVKQIHSRVNRTVAEQNKFTSTNYLTKWLWSWFLEAESTCRYPYLAFSFIPFCFHHFVLSASCCSQSCFVVFFHCGLYSFLCLSSLHHAFYPSPPVNLYNERAHTSSFLYLIYRSLPLKKTVFCCKCFIF